MMLQLSKLGQNELAYQLVESERFPSWGYSIAQGATTIWERWDGFVKGRGFQDKGMNSFNHYSLGAVGEWLYSVVLGINFDEDKPGMEHIILRPMPGGYITVRERKLFIHSWKNLECVGKSWGCVEIKFGNSSKYYSNCNSTDTKCAINSY